MKKLSLVLLVVMMLASVIGVDAQSANRPLSLGIGYAKTTYNGEFGNSMFDLGEKLQGSLALKGGIYLSPSFDLGLSYTQGDFGITDTMMFDGKEVERLSAELRLFHASFDYKFANGKIMSEDSKIRPFISAGIGGATFVPHYIPAYGTKTVRADRSLVVPVGVGAKYYITDGLNIWWQSKYMFSFKDNIDFDSDEDGNDKYLQHSLGLAYDFQMGVDTDGDGITDKADLCPTVAGLKEFDGCPDSDGDGIKDSDDMCPLKPGTAENNGCPDSDGDGVIDKDDMCPDEAGVANLGGCPDGDGDGVADKDDKCPTVAGTAATMGCPDNDGDGIANADDECPNDKGTRANKGCPDSDGDGVPDNIDECVGEAGTKATMGCPDGDGDGVADKNDDCPEKAGPADNRGCPKEKDTDGDGVIDKFDKCPGTPGLKSNKGCPEVKKEVKEILQKALEGIYFNTNSNVIKNKSYEVLNNVVRVMKENPDYRLLIEGHTDDRGNDEYNRELSDKRAKSVREYLVNKGVDGSRMRAMGFGETRPVASNDTEAGRARNRRVAFVVEWK